MCEREDLLRKAGFSVDASRLNTSRIISTLKQSLPAAILIDLDRVPSNGRGVAAALRNSPSTRHIPLVFAGGADDKVAIVRQEFPDAAYTPWGKAPAAIRKAIKNPPATPARVPGVMDRYAGAGLARKLGLPSATPCALIGSPEGFAETIDGLPEAFSFQPRIAADTKLIVWFVRTADEMVLAVERASAHMPQGASVWFIFPKRAGSLRADFNSDDVRETGIELGLVDYKICSVDADWTAMKFARRKK